MDIRLWTRKFLDFLWPLVCAHCREDLPGGPSGALCLSCRAQLIPLEAPFCLRCADVSPLSRGFCASCQGKKFACRLIRAAFLYRGPLHSWVYSFKYRGRFPAAREAGRLMARHWARFRELSVPEILVPVPLHFRRENERGYNQAEVLARAISRETGIPVLNPLVRVRKTKPQWQLDKKSREQNISGAFKAARPGDVWGKRLLLIDDVCTTGFSLEACAAELRRSGAADVCAYAFAREV